MCATRSCTTAMWWKACSAKGAVFVEELDEIPDTDAPVIFSAHGVPKSIPAEAAAPQPVRARRHLPAGHQGASRGRNPFRRGREIVLIGHAGHPEVVGTHGPVAAPARSRWSRPWRTPKRSSPRDAGKLAYRDADHAVGRRHRRHRRRAQAPLSRTSSGRTRRTSATPPPTARRRSKRVAPHGRRHDRGRRAELVEFAAPAGGGRARRLPARRAGAARRRDRLARVRRHHDGSASPPAPRRRRCWSRRSSTRFAERLRVDVETVSAAEESMFFPCRLRAAAACGRAAS